VRGTLFTVQKALPLIVDGGSIIMNGSVASVKGFPAFGVYNASKAAVRSFARTWTVDLKARKIRVNALSPGTIDTDLDGLPKEAKNAFVALIPRHHRPSGGDRDRRPSSRPATRVRHRYRAVRGRRRRPDLTGSPRADLRTAPGLADDPSPACRA
jgi:NAD(P)-dependent dehydrogenase (short-subunit alcohol dehydrogenase family)